jgi:hypothetical protein
LQLASNDPDAVFHCQLDGGTEHTCPRTPILSPLPEGVHTMKAWAVDGSGNAGDPSTFTWTVDTTPPEVTFFDPPLSTPASTTFHYTIDDPKAIVTCTVDASPVTCSSTSVKVNNLDSGLHILRVRAQDLAKNEGKPQQWKWTVVDSSSGTPPANTTPPSTPTAVETPTP